MSIIMSKELLIRIPEPLYRRVKKVCADEYKSMSAFVRELLKERVDEVLSSEDWDDINIARKEFKTKKSVSWRSIKRGKV
ncbi:MAG: ribbon-helix-helix protein, CopG family [Candidatus Omnitrophica bacterium]|nr:ribbon-helix-helix protein, CopG family [Candidatus Omnitrophota bacterium]